MGPAINVTINAQRVRRDGKAQVIMYVSFRGRARYSFPFAIEPAKWNDKLRRVKPGANAIQYNRTIALKIAEVERLALEDGATAQSIVHRLDQGDPTGEVLSEAIAKVIARETQRFEPTTAIAMGTVVKDVQRVLPEVRLGELSSSHIGILHRSLKEQGCKVNTVRSRLRRLRILYRHACKATGLPYSNAFEGQIPAAEDVPPRFLSPAEVERLRGSDVHALARDAWLLSMYLGGMRVGDLCRLKRSSIQDGAVTYIQGKGRKKRHRWIPLIPPALQILQRYTGQRALPLAEDDGYREVAKATTVLNKGLKLIAAQCELPPGLSMHWARHSFANWAVESHVELDTIRMILGHSSVRTTELYIARFDKTRVGRVFERLSEAMGVGITEKP